MQKRIHRQAYKKAGIERLTEQQRLKNEIQIGPIKLSLKRFLLLVFVTEEEYGENLHGLHSKHDFC